MSRNTACHLLELPGELRSMIFGHLFQDARITFSESGPLPRLVEGPNWLVLHHNTNVSILATCRFLHREAFPIFWNTFEMFIPSSLLYDFRETGLWSQLVLHKMTSLRPQIQNISIGASLCGDPRDNSIPILSMITCFVADLKYYSNLKRLTLTSIDEGRALQHSHPDLQGQETYEYLSDAERQQIWDHVKSTQRVFGHSSHRNNHPCWIHLWRPVYDLIMKWRSNPTRANVFDDATNNRVKSSESKLASSKTFKVYHRSYEQLHFMLKGRVLPGMQEVHDVYATPLREGEMPPLIYEAEVVEDMYEHFLVPRGIRLVGEHRAFWQQSDPPKQLTDVAKLPSLLLSYPFWIPVNGRSCDI